MEEAILDDLSGIDQDSIPKALTSYQSLAGKFNYNRYLLLRKSMMILNFTQFTI